MHYTHGTKKAAQRGFLKPLEQLCLPGAFGGAGVGAAAQHGLAMAAPAGAGSSRNAEAGTSKVVGGENVGDDVLQNMSSCFVQVEGRACRR